MDNWLRFQYLIVTELRGRRKKAGAGNGNPVQARYPVRRKIRVPKGEDVMRTEESVGKPVSWLPRKAAIVYYEPVP